MTQLHLSHNEKKWLTIGYSLGAIHEMNFDDYTPEEIRALMKEALDNLNWKFSELEIRNLIELVNEFGMQRREQS